MQDDVQALNLLNAYRSSIESSRFAGQQKSAGTAPEDFLHTLLETDATLQVALMRAALSDTRPSVYYTLLSQLCKRTLPYTVDDIQAILSTLITTKYPSYRLPAQALLRSLARSLAEPETLAVCRPQLERLREVAGTWYATADQRRLLKLLDLFLSGQQERFIPVFPDHWGQMVLISFENMEHTFEEAWLALLRHCARAGGSVPTRTWRAQARQLTSALDSATFARLSREWLEAFSAKHDERLDEDNATLLKGLVWCCTDIEDVALASALADAALEGYRKLAGLGPRSAKVAAACVYTLSRMPGLHGAAQLERVRLNVKQPTYRAGIEKALEEAAQRAGMSREDLEELTVPTFGLQQATVRLPIGSVMAELRLAGSSVHTQWYDATEHTLKTLPAAVKRTHKTELADLKRLSDTIGRMLIAQRDRIERLPLTERTWSLPPWQERYLHHPLVGSIAQRLIWHFTDGECSVDAIWHDGTLVDVHDCPVNLSATAMVSAWHPIFCDAADVLAWRLWLEQHQVTQPFKQAHREVYLLTDAERTTRIYSNRFAAHILRQHQFNALAAARGWRNTLRLLLDDSYPPATLELPYWNLRAEFWIEGAGAEYGTDTNEAGTFLHVRTDQVRLYPMDAPVNHAHAGGGGYGTAYDWQQRRSVVQASLPLEQIPPLVFSEVMRDVDLFVGVASVGNDPTWQDGGPQGLYRDYWHSYSFGDLSATAETRRHLLSRLLPRLAIADRCLLDGRFLKVRGDLRTYKIHLGSGNILMEPNDQYLCIVPWSVSPASLTPGFFLPFEGDTVFSIIVSKAFLLADDSGITDPSIMRQIGTSKKVLA